MFNGMEMVHMCILIEFTIMVMNKQGSSAQCETRIVECIYKKQLHNQCLRHKYNTRSQYCTSVSNVNKESSLWPYCNVLDSPLCENEVDGRLSPHH